MIRARGKFSPRGCLEAPRADVWKLQLILRDREFARILINRPARRSGDFLFNFDGDERRMFRRQEDRVGCEIALVAA